jgi:hypothetical protein
MKDTMHIESVCEEGMRCELGWRTRGWEEWVLATYVTDSLELVPWLCCLS